MVVAKLHFVRYIPDMTNTKRQPKEIKVDVAALCRYFGGAVTIKDRLELRGHAITLKAVEKWRERGRVPGYWLMELAAIAVEDGRELRLSEFLHLRSLRPQEQRESADLLMG